MADSVQVKVNVKEWIEEFVDLTKKDVKDRLMQFGAVVRLIAQRSIKPATQKAIKQSGGQEVYSKPGQPPLSKLGFLKELMAFAWDPITERVVIGPIKFRKGNTPEVLEKGGEQIIQTGKGVNRHTETISILPRPYMGPALSKAQGKLQQIFRKSLKK